MYASNGFMDNYQSMTLFDFRNPVDVGEDKPTGHLLNHVFGLNDF
jgi:hypothetical protein